AGAPLHAGDLAGAKQRHAAPLRGGLDRREAHEGFYILARLKEHLIAVIPGDGIGREVIPEGVRVLEAVGAKHGLRFAWKEFPWSCDWYKAHGRMCPEDAPEVLRKFDAVYFGAVGNPAIVPD